MVRIGDEIYVHGYIDEIRKDTIIIRNEGGYFGTVEHEIVHDPPDAWDNGYTDGEYAAHNTAIDIIDKEISTCSLVANTSEFTNGMKRIKELIERERDKDEL